MANSRLDPYRDEILQMMRARHTQAEILQRLATEYGLTVSKSSLSEYIKKQTNTGASLAPDAPRVSPEEEHFLAQAEVYGELQASARALLDGMQDVIAVLKETGSAVYTLATDTERRDGNIHAGLQQVHSAMASLAKPTGIPSEQPHAPPAAPSGIPSAIVRKIWKRALLVTGIFWLVVIFLLRRYAF